MARIKICPFAWKHWETLWRLRFWQLSENGIVLDVNRIPSLPEADAAETGEPVNPEWDFDQIERVYLRGAGGFWLAWLRDSPAGYVGGQDLGGVVELRRMYVRSGLRRRGVATQLVRSLVEHCRARGVKAVELWTDEEGPGLPLYRKLGFRVTEKPGPEFRDVLLATRRAPSPGEVRMRLELRA